MSLSKLREVSWRVMSLFVLCALGMPLANAAENDASTQFFETHPNEIDLEERDGRILFANRQIGFEFQRAERGVQLARIYSIADKQDFLTRLKPGEFRNMFEIRMTLDPKFVQRDDRKTSRYGHFVILDQMAGDDSFVIGSNEGKNVSWMRDNTSGATTLRIHWKHIDARQDKDVMDVEVAVTLRTGDPLSSWRINILNRSIYGVGERNYPRPTKFGIERVRFPMLTFAPIGDASENVFLYPRRRGGLIEKPFRTLNSLLFYPHDFNMQFQAFYNRQSKSGLYLGTHDPAASFMCYDIRHRDTAISYAPAHFPPNITFTALDFNLPYDCVIGALHGDWYDACQIYREWAVKQSWCQKGTMLVRKDTPKWYKEAPLFLYTTLGDSAEGAHSLEKNLGTAEKHILEFMNWAKLPLPVNLYDWSEEVSEFMGSDIPISDYRRPRAGRWEGFSSHEAHGGNYPKVPAVKGLSATLERVRIEGAMVCPYVALELFDAGPLDNAPYAAEAEPNLVRDLYGAKRRWGSQTSYQPCVVTPWWRNRVRETCELMLQRENVGGFYFDVLQGCSLPCYWTPHGHTAAGGDSMSRGMHEMMVILSNAIRAEDPDALITGENSSENMIDVSDGILQVALLPENTQPVFAAVYQDYIRRYGLEVSVAPGDDFFIECGSMFAEGMQVGRIRLRPRAGNLSLQKEEHKEMLAFLKQVVDFYKQDEAKKFLAYGRLLRPPAFQAPSQMPMLSYNKGAGTFPSLMSNIFRADDGQLGVFVVNVSNKELEFNSDLDLASYQIPKGSSVDVDRINADGKPESIHRGASGNASLKGTLPPHAITMFRMKAVTAATQRS